MKHGCTDGGPHGWTTTDEQHTVANHVCLKCLRCSKAACLSLTGDDAPQIQFVTLYAPPKANKPKGGK